MSFWDDFVNKLVDKVEVKVKTSLEDTVNKLSSIEEDKETLNIIKKDNEALRLKIAILEEEVNDAREFFNHQFSIFENNLRNDERKLLMTSEDIKAELRMLNIRIDDKERAVRYDMESAVTGSVKAFDERLNMLGEKRGIVMDLLKKIAKLEGDDVHR